MSKQTKVLPLARKFLDQTDQAEREALKGTWRPPGGLMGDMMDGLRRVRRKEMTIMLRYYPATNKSQPEYVVKDEYFFCPNCQKKIKTGKKLHWMDQGEETLAGPFCEPCFGRETESHTHEDGMTYGDSRVYTIEVNKELFDALTVYMANLPEEEVARTKRDPVTSLPENEVDDEDELVF